MGKCRWFCVHLISCSDEHIGAHPSLKDKKNQQRIRTRIRRLGEGLYGDYDSVGKGTSELRMFFGSGYRVYFGEDADNIVILLYGGDKDS
ncbi:type II toxin-antitoxin system RelE/ParE family toxin [Nitrosomonas communis]|uniref:Putative addiction module killer protein n=1 Tax=Nitrosomonas communis TaxID=44574 RepID=A0A1I4TV47_9PROT|nr:type II toxin-antitoxin system RelE/ParE family toxin [Nitrosomonas communis]SFM80584.1 putative addiction module killer protein [Nitrosomonas communis]